jgi:hypothetical protein
MIANHTEKGSHPETKDVSSHPPHGSANLASAHFYQVRSRFSMGLLIFAVAFGIPIIGVPKLRHRLSERVQVLRQALHSPTVKLVTLKVGENKEAFPEEYIRSNFKPPSTPQFVSVQLMPHPSSKTAPIISDKVIRPGKTEQHAGDMPSETQATATSDAADSAPRFQQGRIEKEAYNILLQANSTVSEMVLDKNPAFQFKSWLAAKQQEEGSYLVDLAFNKMPEKQEEHFIWQVNLLSKQITPMSYNAKTLPKP